MNFIFDFDGTLVDSFHVAIKKFNILADEFNFRRIDENEVDELKNLTSMEFIKHIGIPLYKLPSVLLKARALIKHEITTLPPFENIRNVLQALHDANMYLGIVTSNSLENVTEWLQSNHMQTLFNFIHVESNFFGKKHVLKKIIKSYKMNKAETYYIGDETRDIDAAKACQIHSVAVTWGFNSEKVLAEHQPSFIASKPEDLLKLCEAT